MKLNEQFEYGSAADSSRQVSDLAHKVPFCPVVSDDDLRAQGAAAERARILGIIDKWRADLYLVVGADAFCAMRAEIEREPTSGGKA